MHAGGQQMLERAENPLRWPFALPDVCAPLPLDPEFQLNLAGILETTRSYFRIGAHKG